MSDTPDLSKTTKSGSTLNSVETTLAAITPTFADFSLGFALDAGGSITKVVYRSKEDYSEGVPKNNEHVLRLRFFPNHQGDALIEFLKENCDIRAPSQDGGADERPLYFQTGVGVQHYVKKLEEAFNCRIKIISEADAGLAGIRHVFEHIPHLKQTVAFDVDSTRNALVNIREFMQTIMRAAQAGIDMFGKPPTPSADFDLPAYMGKLMMVEPSVLAEELSSKPITWPCVVAQCGSANSSCILHEDGTYEMGDFSQVAGKTLLGLARLLTGAKDFDELVELASKGDRSKVDMLSGNLKNKDREDKDWYSMMPDSFPVFIFGKPAEERFDGTYTKEDIAASLFYMHCTQLSHFGVNVARLRRLTSVVFSGSFCNSPFSQKTLQECFLGETLILPLQGEPMLTMHIFPNCGFLTALGTWHENVTKIAKP